MTSATPMTPEMESLKAHLKATWMSGDYAHFAEPMLPDAFEEFERLNLCTECARARPRAAGQLRYTDLLKSPLCLSNGFSSRARIIKSRLIRCS